MTIQNNGTRNQYTATSGQTIFPYTFEIFASGDLTVEQNGSVITTYTVSGVGNDAGGNVTLDTGATTGDVITIYRDMDLERLTDYQNNGDFLASEVNDDYDRIWAALQQLQTNTQAALRPSPSDTALNSSNTELASIATRGGKALGFNPDGTLAYLSSAVPSGNWHYFTTVGAMQASSDLSVNDIVVLGDRNGAIFDVIASTTNDGYKTIDGTASTVSVRLQVNSLANIREFGADGVGDDTGPIQAAIDEGIDVLIPDGKYSVDALTVSTNGQRIFFRGGRLVRRTSGIDILTVNANDCLIEYANVGNDGGGTGFTGDNIVNNGVRNKYVMPITNQCLGVPFIAKGSYDSLILWGGEYNLDNAAAAGAPPIQLGEDTNSAQSLYAQVISPIVNENVAPMRTYGASTCYFSGGQVGGLELLTATGGAASNSNTVQGMRITGDVDVDGAGHLFTGNRLGAYTVTFNATANTCKWVDNTESAGHAITNNGNANNLIIRQVNTGSTIGIRYGDDTAIAKHMDITATGPIEVFHNFRMRPGFNFQYENGAGGYNTIINASTSQLFVGNSSLGLNFVGNNTQTYTPTNVVTTRSFDANTVTLAQLADVVGTMIADDQALGLKD